MRQCLGFDVGGSSMKWGSLFLPAPGDPQSSLRWETGGRIPLSPPVKPAEVMAAVAEAMRNSPDASALGLALPSVIKNGSARTAANVSSDWIGFSGEDASRFLRSPAEPGLAGSASETRAVAVLINDADAAGRAELYFNKQAGGALRIGTTLMLTLGTGIGSALFVNGHLVPNTEFGHLLVGSREAEHLAAAQVKAREGIGWEEWGRRLGLVIAEYERLLWPDHIVIGGAISSSFQDFIRYLTPGAGNRAELMPASLGNDAGWLGAALVAAAGGGNASHTAVAMPDSF